MKPRSSVKYGIGFVIADCLLIVEAIINIRTGRITGTALLVIVALSVMIGIILFALAKKHVRGNRGASGSAKVTEQESTEDIEKASENDALH